MEAQFARHEPVTVVDPSNPFHHWSGTVESWDARLDVYTISARYMGWGRTELQLTFRSVQLQPGVPATVAAQGRDR